MVVGIFFSSGKIPTTVTTSDVSGRDVSSEKYFTPQWGKRPVTLIGYSLGARVIFSCIEEMSKRKGGDGIVEDVILLGAPVTGDPAVWQRFKPVVAGKIINGYCRGDWLLKFLYRTSSVQMSIAGLRPVEWSDRRMHNIDLSDVVNGHMDYRNQLDIIMKAVGVRTRDDVSQRSRKTSPKLSPDSEEYELETDDISSSDDDLLSAPDTESQPVILEDYTLPEGMRSQTGSVASGSTIEDPYRGNIVESASFDSGVDIHRAKSEPTEKLSCPGDDTPPQATSPENQGQISPELANDGASSLLETSSAVEDNSNQSHPASLHNIPPDDKGPEGIPSYSQFDRIGDAGAAGGSDEDEDTDWSVLHSSSLDETGESAEDLVSNLQRKKLFDSMYRLVIDDDLADILNEDDDDYIGPVEDIEEETLRTASEDKDS